MSVELLRQDYKVNQVIGEDTAQMVVENDIIVPDIKPDVANILLLDGDVLVDEARIAQDELLVNGVIRYKILYTADDEERAIKSINTSGSFSFGLDIPNSRQGMDSKVKCEIEHMDYEILNGRKINIKAILKVSGKVLNEREVSVAYGVSGIDDIQVLKRRFSLNSYLGKAVHTVALGETLDIPAGKPSISEILRNDVKITGKDYKIVDNKIVTKGEVNISTLYIGDDEGRSIQFLEHAIPFVQSLDLDDITQDAVCDMDFSVGDVQFEAVEDNDGEFRLMRADVNLNIVVEGYSKSDIEVLDDSYSPSVRLNLEKEVFRVEEFIADGRSQISIKETMVLGDDKQDISEIFNVICTPALLEYSVADDKVILEGLVNAKILYLGDSSEQPVVSYEQELPFKHTIEVRGADEGMGCDIDLYVEQCSYSMLSSREIEMRLGVGVVSRVIRLASLPLIDKIVEADPDDKRSAEQPSVLIYFSQPGDTLWDIAKRYYTTMEDIRRINDIEDSDLIKPGRQVIIPKRQK